MLKLLLLHGALDTKSQFEQLNKLLKLDFEIYTMNFSGHGGAEMPAGDFSIKFFAEEVLNFLKDRNIKAADIAGHSMGGYAGLYLARFHPERVNKVFALNTKLLWNDETAANEVKMLDAEKILQKVPKFADRLKNLHKPNDWKVLLQKVSAMLTDMGKDSCLNDDDFEKIENTVMLCVGDKDNMAGIEDTAKFFRKLKNGSMLVLPDTRHPFESISTERLAYEFKRFFAG